MWDNFLRTIKKNYTGWLLLIPGIILLLYIVWSPILRGTQYSFFKLAGFTPIEFVGFRNYIEVVTDTFFLQILGNTVKYVLWSLLIGLPLPLIVAVFINEMIHGKEFFKFSTYFPMIVPGVAASLIWWFIYQPGKLGLLNSLFVHLGLPMGDWLQNKDMVIPLIIISATWNSFGATMMMYLASLQGVKQELYDASRVDGAGLFGRVRHVMMPHMYGVILLLAIRQVISVFQIMEQPLAMTYGGPNNASMTLALQGFFYAFRSTNQVGKSLALGMITFVMLIVLTWVYLRFDKKINH